MSTSGTYSFGVSRDDIIRESMLNIKRLDPDETPTPAETNDCARKLNMMCKQWQGKSDFAPGLKTWTRKRGYMLLSNTGQYTVGPAATGWTNSLAIAALSTAAAAGATTLVLSTVVGFATPYNIAVALDSGVMFYTTINGAPAGNVVTLLAPLPSSASGTSAVFGYQTAAQNIKALETALLRDSTYNDTPLTLMLLATYDQLPTKVDPQNTGDPTALYFEEGIKSSGIFLDIGSAQDLSKYLVITYQEPIQDFVNPLDEPYYSNEWFLALCWGLTEQIAPMFGALWNDKMEQLKNSALAMARNHGAEKSDMYFMPGND
jgi:hypothetical protein